MSSLAPPGTFHVRLATAADATGIADAHVDSIHTLGATAYDSDVVADWGAPRTGDRYVQAMAGGERIFVAVDGDGQILGFAGHRVASGAHRIAVYVRGSASRRRVGSAMFAAAEADARAAGAREILVDASLVAAPFYAALGFEVQTDAVYTLRSGRSMACIKMRKPLA